MISKNIAHCFQGAFVKGRRGTDHLLVLNTLIDVAKATSTKLYAAMLDLSCAFDSINRALLSAKLVDYGLGPKFCNILVVFSR